MTSLRYDILLAHLLFGMMLLTSAIAVANALGDALLGGRNIAPRVRAGARALLACALVAAVLLAFTSVRVESGAFAFDVGRGVLGNASGTLLSRTEVLRVETAPSEGAGLDDTWTSLEPRSAELDAPLAPWARVARLEGATTDDLCATWTGILAREAGAAPATDARDANVVVVCASELADDARIAAAEAHVVRGAGLVVVGPVPNAATAGAAKLLDGLKFRSLAEAGEPASLAFGGPGFVSGSPLRGLVLGFGDAWQAAPGNVAVAEGPAQPVGLAHTALPLWPASTALWLGPSRRAWTSLPPVLYGKLAAIVGTRWRLVARSMIAQALGLPNVALPFARAGAEVPHLVFTPPEKDAASAGPIAFDLGEGDRGMALGRGHAVGADVVVSARRWTHVGPWLATRVKSGEALAAAAATETIARPTLLVMPAAASLAEGLGVPSATFGATPTPPADVQAFTAWQRTRATLATAFTSTAAGSLDLVIENRGTTPAESFHVAHDGPGWRPNGSGARWSVAGNGSIAIAILAAGERLTIPFGKGAP